MTERLYYSDSYTSEFTATVVGTDPAGARVDLNYTFFYPASGGQPYDLGVLSGIPVIGVEEQDGSVVHLLAQPLPVGAGAEVQCEIDWQRRFDHMQQHTGQHLLSAVLVEMFGLETVSFHMSAESSTIEIEAPALETDVLEAAERRANEIVAQNRPVHVSFEDAATASGLRKASARTGTLRIVAIENLDRSACGGTHVRATGEIGCILLRGTEKIRRNTRLEFVCGMRAVRRARGDYRQLQSIAGRLSASVDDCAGIIDIWAGRLTEAEKSSKKLSLELAQFRGRDKYVQTLPAASGVRVCELEVEALTDDVRAEAQSFTAGPRSAFVAWTREKPALLLAVSVDSGLHAGNLLKPLLSQHGGRGGGSAQSAQGSVPSADAMNALLGDIRAQL